jgi:diguanylate cyclase (GGDEF)-like protein
MDSNVGLAIQCVGALLITLLPIFIRSANKRQALKYWTVAWIVPAIAVSLILPYASPNLKDVFMIHAAILAVLFLTALFTFRVFTESVRREMETTNKKLLQARDQLELLVQMDPLTEALNRHAFHSLLRRPESGGEDTGTSGSVAVIDIDNLKPINDTMGHTTGDRAIRAVARAMRSLVRADDMLFRWGGDEFLVLMFKLPQPEASRRMEKLNRILEENVARWIGTPLTVTVSFGVAGFTSLTDLGQAIEQADKAMYAQRNRVRGLPQNAQKSTQMVR